MTDEHIPNVRKLFDIHNCVECGSSNLRDYIGDVFDSKCHHCNDCEVSFGHCKFCDKSVLINDYTKLSYVSKDIDVEKILRDYDDCKFKDGSLLIPDDVWDKLDLKDADVKTIARSGSWSSYCRECENELLISIWFIVAGKRP